MGFKRLEETGNGLFEAIEMEVFSCTLIRTRARQPLQHNTCLTLRDKLQRKQSPNPKEYKKCLYLFIVGLGTLIVQMFLSLQFYNLRFQENRKVLLPHLCRVFYVIV